MTRAGTNLKIDVARSHHAALGRFLAEGFGAKLTHHSEAMDIYHLDDGYSIGLFSVPDDQALAPDAWERAPWLEFAVDDVERADGHLLACGATRVAFRDQTHRYYRMPGGPVFRSCQ